MSKLNEPIHDSLNPRPICAGRMPALAELPAKGNSPGNDPPVEGVAEQRVHGDCDPTTPPEVDSQVYDPPIAAVADSESVQNRDLCA